MSKKKLDRAAELIRNKDYEGARRILVTIKKDPTAQKWLARIEELAPRPKKKRAWWATGIGAGAVVLGVLIVCSLAGQALNIIPTAEESGATKTVVVAMTDDANRGTQVAINTGMTQTAAQEATNIALTPSATVTINDTPVPTATVTLTHTPAPPPVPVFDRVTYIQQLTDGLFILAGGRDIVSVDVADGRAQGGERVVLIAYRTAESNQQGYEDEWIDIFRAVAATIKAQELDVDSVTLIVGRADDSTAGTMVAQVEDLMDLLDGRIPREVFFERLSVTTF